jgi:hypothetical protein
MSIQQVSPAVAVARAHVEAWANHDWNTARSLLAPNVKVRSTSTKPDLPHTDLEGIDPYMEGLKHFAQAVVPGSLEVVASMGDKRNALLLVNIQAIFGPGMPPVALPGARLYLLDENNKIAAEQVIFYAAAD